MPKLYFENENCYAATSGATGNKYHADKQGFINVENSADLKCLTSGGYKQVGAMPRVSKYFECECGWHALINSCPRCNRTDLTKVYQ